jgi:hypothetical protein
MAAAVSAVATSVGPQAMAAAVSAVAAAGSAVDAGLAEINSRAAAAEAKISQAKKTVEDAGASIAALAAQPVPWKEYKDDDGRTYFYNTASSESVWEIPPEHAKLLAEKRRLEKLKQDAQKEFELARSALETVAAEKSAAMKAAAESASVAAAEKAKSAAAAAITAPAASAAAALLPAITPAPTPAPKPSTNPWQEFKDDEGRPLPSQDSAGPSSLFGNAPHMDGGGGSGVGGSQADQESVSSDLELKAVNSKLIKQVTEMQAAHAVQATEIERLRNETASSRFELASVKEAAAASNAAQTAEIAKLRSSAQDMIAANSKLTKQVSDTQAAHAVQATEMKRLRNETASSRFELASLKEASAASSVQAAAQIARLKDEIAAARLASDEARASAAAHAKALQDLQYEVQAAADARAAAASRCAAEERLTPFLKFDRHYSTSPVPQFADELLAAVRKTIFKYCDQNGGEEAEARRFFKALQDEAFSHAQDLSDSIAVSACLIWTSQLRLTFRDGRSIEFCGILNRVLRDRVEDVLPDACVVVRAVNSMCVMRHDVAKLMYALRQLCCFFV